MSECKHTIMTGGGREIQMAASECPNCLRVRAEAAEAKLAEAEKFHPRAMKLIAKRKKFVVIAVDEPYFVDAYKTIRAHEQQAGRWTDEDELKYQTTFWE